MSYYPQTLDEIIVYYDEIMKNVDSKAYNQKHRAYGGAIRATKGQLQELITHSLILIAWKELGGNMSELKINKDKIPIPIVSNYVDNLKDDKVRNYILNNLEDYKYKLSVDKHVFIKGKFVIGIECKAYTENAMIKRILMDFKFLLQNFPNLKCFLFQLESQLGGDYSKLSDTTYGSKSTHAIMSHFDFNLSIITLLSGERDIQKPIHKFYKPLIKGNLIKAKNILKKALHEFI